MGRLTHWNMDENYEITYVAAATIDEMVQKLGKYEDLAEPEVMERIFYHYITPNMFKWAKEEVAKR